MDEKKLEIIGNALQVYMKYGIKSVTMDEMARQLGVSKKTLYQYVSDKNDLVEQCIQCAHHMDMEMIKIIIAENENAIDEVLAISKQVSEELKKVHPSIFFDLAKYHPNALKMMECHKDEFIKDTVKDNMRKGMKQGLYRSNLNVEVVSNLYLSTLDHILAGDFSSYKEMTTEEVYQEVFRYHIRGIASDEGIKYLIEKLNNK